MSIQKILEDKLDVEFLESFPEHPGECGVTGIPEAVKAIEGMNCTNCKFAGDSFEILNLLNCPKSGLIVHVDMVARHGIKCNEWEATK